MQILELHSEVPQSKPQGIASTLPSGIGNFTDGDPGTQMILYLFHNEP